MRLAHQPGEREGHAHCPLQGQDAFQLRPAGSLRGHTWYMHGADKDPQVLIRPSGPSSALHLPPQLVYSQLRRVLCWMRSVGLDSVFLASPFSSSPTSSPPLPQ